VLLMAIQVAEAPMMPMVDYWMILGRALNDDGSLYERGLLTFQWEHPTFLPGLVYYLNAAYLGGTNTVLSVLSLLLGLATVLLLVRALPISELGRARAAVAMVAITWLIFTPKGLHNFAYGFSGVAWLSANLLVVSAILLTARGRFWWALTPALAACACYGTGFAVWPALLVAQFLRGSKRRVRVTTALLGIGVGILWLVARPTMPTSGAGGDWPSYVQAWFALMGSLWTSTSIDLATIAGLLVAGAAAAFTFRVLSPHLRNGRGWQAPRSDADAGTGAPSVPPTLVPWLSLLVWGVFSGGLIAMSRAETTTLAGLDSRYASIPALTICAVLVLGLLAHPRVGLPRLVVPTALLLLLGMAGSTGVYRAVHDNYTPIELTGIAARAGVTDSLTGKFFRTDRLTAMENLGAYPFNSMFRLDCGGVQLGDSIDVSGRPGLAPTPPTGPGPSIPLGLSAGAVDERVAGEGVRLEGWAVVDGRQADCVLLVQDDRVIGAGVTGLPRPNVAEFGDTGFERLGWRAFAPAGYRPTDIDVIVVAGDARYLMPAPGGD
jgi:hypothetical protein